MKRIVAVLAVVGFFLSAGFVSADDFSEAVSLISVNAPAGADVAGMGNTWVALPDFSSNNPAVYAAGEETGKMKGSVTGTYTFLGFKRGPDVSSYALTPSIKLPVGFLKLSLVSASSREAETKMGMNMQHDSFSSVNIGYGLKVASRVFGKEDKLFFGLDVTPYSQSMMTFSSEGERIFRSESKSYAFGAGLLYQPIKGVNVGAYYNYGGGDNKDRDYVEGETVDSKSTNQLLRIGASWQILPMTLVSADWQYVNLDGYRKGQMFVGIEQGIIKDLLYVYGGWTANGPTAGIGVYFKKGGINVSYMSNPFSEADRYLGKSRVVSVAIYWTF